MLERLPFFGISSLQSTVCVSKSHLKAGYLSLSSKNFEAAHDFCFEPPMTCHVVICCRLPPSPQQCTCEARIEKTQDCTKVNSRVVVWTPVGLKGLLGASKNVACEIHKTTMLRFDGSIFQLMVN